MDKRRLLEILSEFIYESTINKNRNEKFENPIRVMLDTENPGQYRRIGSFTVYEAAEKVLEIVKEIYQEKEDEQRNTMVFSKEIKTEEEPNAS